METIHPRKAASELASRTRAGVLCFGDADRAQSIRSEYEQLSVVQWSCSLAARTSHPFGHAAPIKFATDETRSVTGRYGSMITINHPCRARLLLALASVVSLSLSACNGSSAAHSSDGTSNAAAGSGAANQAAGQGGMDNNSSGYNQGAPN
jgi:hypothetical protein